MLHNNRHMNSTSLSWCRCFIWIIFVTILRTKSWCFVEALKDWNNVGNNHPINNKEVQLTIISWLHRFRGGADEHHSSYHSDEFVPNPLKTTGQRNSRRRNARSIDNNKPLTDKNQYYTDSGKIKLNGSNSSKKRTRKPKKNVLILKAKKLIVVNDQQQYHEPDIPNEIELPSRRPQEHTRELRLHDHAMSSHKMLPQHTRNSRGKLKRRLNRSFDQDVNDDYRMASPQNNKISRHTTNHSKDNYKGYSKHFHNIDGVPSSSKHNLKIAEHIKINKKKKEKQKQPLKMQEKSSVMKTNGGVRKRNKLKEINQNTKSETVKSTKTEHHQKIKSTILSSLDLLEDLDDKKDVDKNSTQNTDSSDEYKLKRDLNDEEFETLLKDLLQDDSTEEEEEEEEEEEDDDETIESALESRGLNQEVDEENFEYEYYDTSYDYLEVPMMDEVDVNGMISQQNIQNQYPVDVEMDDSMYYDEFDANEIGKNQVNSRNKLSRGESSYFQDNYDYEVIRQPRDQTRYYNERAMHIDFDEEYYDSSISDDPGSMDSYEYVSYDDYDNNYDYFNDETEDFIVYSPEQRHHRIPSFLHNMQKPNRDMKTKEYYVKHENEKDTLSEKMPRNKLVEHLSIQEPTRNIKKTKKEGMNPNPSHDYSGTNMEHAYFNEFEDNRKNVKLYDGCHDVYDMEQHVDRPSGQNIYYDDIKEMDGELRENMVDNFRYDSLYEKQNIIEREYLDSKYQTEFSENTPPNELSPVSIVLREPSQEHHIDSESYDKELLNEYDLLLLNESTNAADLENMEVNDAKAINSYGECKTENIKMKQGEKIEPMDREPCMENEEKLVESANNYDEANKDDLKIVESSSIETNNRKSIFSALTRNPISGWGIKKPWDKDGISGGLDSYCDDKKDFERERASEHSVERQELVENLDEDTVARKHSSEEDPKKLEMKAKIEKDFIVSLGLCEVIVSVNDFFVNEAQTIHESPPTLPSTLDEDLESKNLQPSSTGDLESEIPPAPPLPSSPGEFQSEISSHNEFIHYSQNGPPIIHGEDTYVEQQPPPPPVYSSPEYFQSDGSTTHQYHGFVDYPQNYESLRENQDTDINQRPPPPPPPPPQSSVSNVLHSERSMFTHNNQFEHTNRSYQPLGSDEDMITNQPPPPPPPPPSYSAPREVFPKSSATTHHNELVNPFEISQSQGNEGVMIDRPPPPPPFSSPGEFYPGNLMTTQQNQFGNINQGTEIEKHKLPPPPPPPPP